MSREPSTLSIGRSKEMNKKYPGTAKSPIVNSSAVNRNAAARSRLLTSKIAAPRPINLPSLRREHESDTPNTPPTDSPGWKSSFPISQCKSTEENHVSSPSTSPILSKTAQHHDTSGYPATPPQSAQHAWKVSPTATKESIKGGLLPPDSGLAKNSPDTVPIAKSRQTPSLDSSSKAWDEMIEEDEDVPPADTVPEKATAKETLDNVDEEEESEPVPPSDRFTEDYDRSYPPRLKQIHGDESQISQEDSRRQNSGGSSHRYSAWKNNADDSRVRNTSSDGLGRRKNSISDQRDGQLSDRRLSGRFGAPPTLLQRPSRQESSEGSSAWDTHPPHIMKHAVEKVPVDIGAEQHEYMMSAAEKAKERRDKEEAERAAIQQRARQKALLLAQAAEEKAAEARAIKEKAAQEKAAKENAAKEKAFEAKTIKAREETSRTKHDSLPEAIRETDRPQASTDKQQTPKKAKQAKPRKEKVDKEVNVPNALQESPNTAPAIDRSSKLDESWGKAKKGEAEKTASSKHAGEWRMFAAGIRTISRPPLKTEVIDYREMDDAKPASTHGGQGRDRSRNDTSFAQTNAERHTRRPSKGRAVSQDTWRRAPATEDVVNKTNENSPASLLTQHTDLAQPPTEPPLPKALNQTEENDVMAAMKMGDGKGRRPRHVVETRRITTSRLERLLRERKGAVFFPNEIERVTNAAHDALTFMMHPESNGGVDRMETVVDATTIAALPSKVQEPTKPPAVEVQDVDNKAQLPTHEPEPVQEHGGNEKHVMPLPDPCMIPNNPHFPLLVYELPSADANSISRRAGTQQYPISLYLATPHPMIPSHQNMGPFPQAGAGPAQTVKTEAGLNHGRRSPSHRGRDRSSHSSFRKSSRGAPRGNSSDRPWRQSNEPHNETS